MSVVYIFDAHRAAMPEVRAVYETLEDAAHQAEHDLELGDGGPTPLRIESDDGEVLREF